MTFLIQPHRSIQRVFDCFCPILSYWRALNCFSLDGKNFDKIQANYFVISKVLTWSMNSLITSYVRLWRRGTGEVKMLQDGCISTKNKQSLRKNNKFFSLIKAWRHTPYNLSITYPLLGTADLQRQNSYHRWKTLAWCPVIREETPLSNLKEAHTLLKGKLSCKINEQIVWNFKMNP